MEADPDQKPRDEGPEPEYVPDYQRPEMPFERKASIDAGVGRWSAVGFEFAIYVGVFFLGGKWLDGKLGSEPWAVAIGTLLGVAVGMIMLIRRVSSLSSPAAGGEKAGGEKDKGSS